LVRKTFRSNFDAIMVLVRHIRSQPFTATLPGRRTGRSRVLELHGDEDAVPVEL
jgi:hypothetical protein